MPMPTPTKTSVQGRFPSITPSTTIFISMACGAGSKFGTGGMQTKLHAAHIATEAGVPMVIANGAQPAALYDLMDGKPVGTKFLAREEKA